MKKKKTKAKSRKVRPLASQGKSNKARSARGLEIFYNGRRLPVDLDRLVGIGEP